MNPPLLAAGTQHPWLPSSKAQCLYHLSHAVAGRPMFRLACSEINSWALLRNGNFTLINRKKTKQNPAQKEPLTSKSGSRDWGRGGRVHTGKWPAPDLISVLKLRSVCLSGSGTSKGTEEGNCLSTRWLRG